MGEVLYWDSSYAIARRLMEGHPEVRLEDVSYQQVFAWVIALPDFGDDPDLVNDGLLQAILQEWYEEAMSV
jgi:FeS assembly protein IscX